MDQFWWDTQLTITQSQLSSERVSNITDWDNLNVRKFSKNEKLCQRNLCIMYENLNLSQPVFFFLESKNWQITVRICMNECHSKK